MNRSTIEAIYDKQAKSYDRTVGLTENFLLGDFRERFAQSLRGESLEIAIGSGLNLPYYGESVTSATGVDLSSKMLVMARKRAESLGLALDLAQMDAEQLGFADDSFDTVAISLALCTTPNPRAVLSEMARVCRPNGHIVFLEHINSPNRLASAVLRLLSPMQERRLGGSLTQETVALIKSVGFVIDEDRSRWFGVFRFLVTLPPPVELPEQTPPFRW
jgi:ubiquinone/menaquinone biosynthesis C-methylase UbiE